MSNNDVYFFAFLANSLAVFAENYFLDIFLLYKFLEHIRLPVGYL
jgi:hypothetical protein